MVSWRASFVLARAKLRVPIASHGGDVGDEIANARSPNSAEWKRTAEVHCGDPDPRGQQPVDHAFTDNVFGRLEYRYNDYGDGDFGVGGDVDFDQHVVQVGIGVKF